MAEHSFNLCFKVKFYSSVEVLFICYDVNVLNLAFMSLVFNNMYSDWRFCLLIIGSKLVVNTHEGTDIRVILLISMLLILLILPLHIRQMTKSRVEF